MPRTPINCPECGTDVMETGFALRSEMSQSYMRFANVGLVQIATAQIEANRAECLQCGARLREKPVDLMRAAG